MDDSTKRQLCLCFYLTLFLLVSIFFLVRAV